MKYDSPISLSIQKIWPMFKFLKSKSNFKVKVRRSKITLPIEIYFKSLVIGTQSDGPRNQAKDRLGHN
jgi:hypothetical protein